MREAKAIYHVRRSRIKGVVLRRVGREARRRGGRPHEPALDGHGAHLAQHQPRVRKHHVRKIAQPRDEQHRDRARRGARERARKQRLAVEQAGRVDRVVAAQVALVRLLRDCHSSRAHADWHRRLADAVEDEPSELRAPSRPAAAIRDDGAEADVPLAVGHREHDQRFGVVRIGSNVGDHHNLRPPKGREAAAPHGFARLQK